MNTKDDEEEECAESTLLMALKWYHDMLAVVGIVVLELPVTRNAPIGQQKLKWDEYVAKFSNNPAFIKRHLRMSLESFFKLLGYIKHGLIAGGTKAIKGGPIMPELSLFCTLRWLAGGSYLDIFALTGVSVASFYRVVYLCLRLIIKSPELDIRLPTTGEECAQVASGFRNISYGEAITNCIGCVDGYLLKTYTPKKKDAGNVRSYFSGHYQCYGMNIQALCDANSRFIFFGVAAPGSVNDREAIKESGLLSALNNLPSEFVILGDAAYEPTERVAPMFYGINKKDDACDAYNFYASQCRIRIEMAFGLMQMKWGILWRPMRVNLENTKFVIQAIARLHNFVIDERILNNEEPEIVPSGRIYRRTEDDRRTEEPEVDKRREAAKRKHLKGVSIIRDTMVERVVDLGLKRPKNNALPKRNRDY